MNAALTITQIQSSDKQQWRRLWTKYLEFYETSVSEDVYESTFQRLVVEDGPEFLGYLARLDGKEVGLVHFLYHQNFWQVGRVCYLQDLYTAPEVRNRGVARALIEKVYSVADAENISTVYWLTHESNQPARYLYDNIAHYSGFIKYSRN